MVVGTFDDRKIDAEYLDTPDGRAWRRGVHWASPPARRWPPRQAGESIQIRGIEIFLVTDGNKISEHWGVIDIADVLTKAGLVPTPGQ